MKLAPWLRRTETDTQTDAAGSIQTPFERRKALLLVMVQTFVPPQQYTMFGSTIRQLFRTMTSEQLDVVLKKLRELVDEVESIT